MDGGAAGSGVPGYGEGEAVTVGELKEWEAVHARAPYSLIVLRHGPHGFLVSSVRGQPSTNPQTHQKPFSSNTRAIQ